MICSVPERGERRNTVNFSLSIKTNAKTAVVLYLLR